MNILEHLWKVIESRKKSMPSDSYTASLFKEGKDRIIQKVGEESIEVVVAAKNDDKQRVVEEYADLLFHSLILLSQLNIHPQDVLKELEKRHTK